MSLYEVIAKRTSVRKYSDRALGNEALKGIIETLDGLKKLDDSSYSRLELITEQEVVKTMGIGFLGGHIKINAPYCIVGITKNQKGALENVGFVLEQAVLKLQEEGIGTCWLGTYNESAIRSVCNLMADEKVAVVIAFGYAEKAFLNNGMRKLANTHKRKAITETAFYQEWGKDINAYLTNNEPLKKVLEMSALYPSSNNNQPVRVIINDAQAVFTVKKNNKSEAYRIDAGIYMAHFYLSCLQEGLSPVLCVDQLRDNNYNIPNEYTYIGNIKYQK